MQQKAKILSLAVAMFAITGMMGFNNQALAGNGANENGKQVFHLNIIGVKKGDKDFSNDTTSSGNRIFIPLFGSVKIGLKEGPFNVNDFDGVSDGYAELQLPKPNLACTDLELVPPTSTPCDPSIPSYFVYARTLGQPNGAEIVFNTCANEAVGGIDFNGDGDFDDQVCSTEILTLGTLDSGPRKGGAKFTNVTRQLLTVCVDTISDGNLDGVCDIRVDIFDPRLEDYFWDVDNFGRKLVQFKFIQV